MSRFTNKIKNLRNNYQSALAQKNMIENTIKKYDKEMEDVKSQIEVCDKTIMLITNVSLDARRKVITILEDMVTDAIKSISEGQYGFKIEIEATDKGYRCEFYISEEVNGEVSLQKPEDACGGGFIDIISTTLRYVYLNVFKSPSMSGSILLDEPAKMVSSGMSCKFGEFVKRLGEDFDRQTIMVTHNELIGMVADSNIEIRKVQ